MISIEEIKAILAQRLKRSRYEHTLRVQTFALELARLNGIDETKTEYAALLHDYAKNMTDDELRLYIEVNGIEIDPIITRNISLSHGKVAAHMVRKKFNIDDDEILDAIECHTYGCRIMTDLSKVIYVADMLEEGRAFEGVHSLREMVLKDLNKGLLESINRTLKYLLDKGLEIHPNSIVMRNELLNMEVENGRCTNN